MALFRGNFFSQSILTGVDVQVILPLPEDDDYAEGRFHGFVPQGGFPTLYLLHGAYDDGSAWQRKTRIECYAKRRGIAVVMASANNSFYLDQNPGAAYGRFFEQELPDFAEAVFPLSSRREDRFVAGLSMGGYGALRMALLHPDRYAAAVSFSGAFDLETIGERLASSFGPGRTVYGNLTQGLDRADWDLAALAQKALDQGQTLPKLMLSCGTEDFTLEMNRALAQILKEKGLDVTYEEHPGAHNWDYWETHIQRALDWLPLAD